MNNRNENTEKQDLKTLNIVIEETKSKLFDVINNSGLPAAILELIAKDIYMQVRDASKQVYQMEKAKYEESLKESTTK